MQYTYPVLSRIGPWMRDKERIAEVKIRNSFTLMFYIFVNWYVLILGKVYSRMSVECSRRSINSL